MITVGPKTASGSWRTRRILLLCALCGSHGVAAQPRPAHSLAPGAERRPIDIEVGEDRSARSAIPALGASGWVRDLRFAHLTTNDGLSQGYVTAILQDRRGFMWFATRDGLNRYDGNTFVV